MYAFFVLVNGSAQVLEWAPNIRIVAFLPCKFTLRFVLTTSDAVVCFVLVELTRLVRIFFPKMEVILPFYSTLLPFGLVCFWSREARNPFMFVDPNF
jgi:hypothetical protein